MSKLGRRLYSRLLTTMKRYPNRHLKGDQTVSVKPPFGSVKIHIRHSRSDVSRIGEYVNKIYSDNNYMHQTIWDSEPSVVIDVGANIGLSSLALVEQLPSVRKVYAIEAELENYKVLQANCIEWRQAFPGVEFVPIQAVVTNDPSRVFVRESLHDIDEALTASGTFRFIPKEENAEVVSVIVPSISMNEIIDELEPNIDNVVCKIDIEGGELDLFSGNTEWLKRVAYLTMEVHDRFDVSLVNSSKPMLQKLYEYDFAIKPSEDILHCYARRFI